MKQLILILAIILWEGPIQDLACDTGRIVLDEDGSLFAERKTLHQDKMGEIVEYWQSNPAEEKAIFKSALIDKHKSKLVHLLGTK